MSLIDWIFPKRCVGCGLFGSFFCTECKKGILQADLICPFCKRPSIGGFTHPICKRRFGLDGLWSLGIYKPPLKTAIQKLKYRWIQSQADILIDIIVEYWARSSPLILDEIKKDFGKKWIVVPVPLHPLRQNWRGFNQAALLGKLLAKKLGLEYADGLKRIKNTTPQVTFSAEKRRQNIKGAFSLSVPLEVDTNILLVDDVWTTGSTLKECCNVLKRSGVKKVWALTIAR